LNRIHVHGALAVALLAGGMAESWLVFAATLAVLVGLSLHTRDIRPDRTAGR